MIRSATIYISREHKDALRLAATLGGLPHPEDALEAILKDWLKANPAYERYLSERSRLRAEADAEALRMSGIEQNRG